MICSFVFRAYTLMQNDCINKDVNNGKKNMHYKKRKKVCKTALYFEIKERREKRV